MVIEMTHNHNFTFGRSVAASKNCDRTPMPFVRHSVLAQNRHGSSITVCTLALYWRANAKYTFAEPSRPTWRRTEPIFVLPACRFCRPNGQHAKKSSQWFAGLKGTWQSSASQTVIELPCRKCKVAQNQHGSSITVQSGAEPATYILLTVHVRKLKEEKTC